MALIQPQSWFLLCKSVWCSPLTSGRTQVLMKMSVECDTNRSPSPRDCLRSAKLFSLANDHSVYCHSDDDILQWVHHQWYIKSFWILLVLDVFQMCRYHSWWFFHSPRAFHFDLRWFHSISSCPCHQGDSPRGCSFGAFHTWGHPKNDASFSRTSNKKIGWFGGSTYFEETSS